MAGLADPQVGPELLMVIHITALRNEERSTIRLYEDLLSLTVCIYTLRSYT